SADKCRECSHTLALGWSSTQQEPRENSLNRMSETSSTNCGSMTERRRCPWRSAAVSFTLSEPGYMTKHAVVSLVVSLTLLLGSRSAAQHTPNCTGTWRPLDLHVTDTSQNLTVRQNDETIAIIEPGDAKTTSVYRLD